MKKIDEGLKEIFDDLGKSSDTLSKAMRSAQVNSVWEHAVKEVYKDAAPLVLEHINAVYIMSADTPLFAERDGVPRKKTNSSTSQTKLLNSSGTQLVVYSDDSLIRSDLDARQEFLKLQLNKQGEHVETFHILPSRFAMKERHPFLIDVDTQSVQARQSPRPPSNVSSQKQDTQNTREKMPSLSSEQEREERLSCLDPTVQQSVKRVENPTIQAALLKAMDADLTRNNDFHKKNAQ